MVNIAEELGASAGRPQRFALYIPNKDRFGKEVTDQKKWIEKAVRLLSDICGGATQMPPVIGAWLNRETDELVIEEPVLVYSFIEPVAFEERLTEVKELIWDIGEQTDQGQMAFEYDGTFYLVDID